MSSLSATILSQSSGSGRFEIIPQPKKWALNIFGLTSATSASLITTPHELKCKAELTKVVIVVSVIVVGILDVDFEPQDLVAPGGDPVVEAHLQNCKTAKCVDNDGDGDKLEEDEGSCMN